MKITTLCGNMPHYDNGLSKVLKVIHNTFAELGVTIAEVNLSYSQLPFFDGIKAQAADAIFSSIRESNGVIFACSAQLFAPTAIMQTALEFFELDEYRDALRDKNCLLVTVSKSGGERSALLYLERVIEHLGGFCDTRIGLQEIHTRHLDSNASLNELIEKETEDFYRSVSRNRRRIIPRDYAGRNNLATMTDADVGSLAPAPEKAKKKVPASEVYSRLNLDAFNERQADDIRALTKLFAQKLSETDDTAAQPRPAPQPAYAQQQPRSLTLRDLTRRLPQYYQKHLAAGLNAVMQFSITGAEAFEGYLSISSVECLYADGTAQNADLTVITDTAVWRDVLDGKYTAQKAFMIGSLRVRGKFTLLTQFDTLFQGFAADNNAV